MDTELKSPSTTVRAWQTRENYSATLVVAKFPDEIIARPEAELIDHGTSDRIH